MRCARLLSLLVLCLLPTGALLAQRNRVRGPVDNSSRIRLTGNLHPNARAENDLGPLDVSEKLTSVTLVMRQSPEQQAALEKLLAEQQDPTSPNYHRWITPEEYGARFGVSDDDMAKVADWLGQQNLRVVHVARSRNAIAFTGMAGDVERAFRTEMRRYQVRGRRHFANATEPSIPVAFDAVIRGISGLDDFRLQPRGRKLQPRYTSASGFHYLSPADLAVIYNVKPLYDAGYTGTGQKLVVVGQTQVDLADTQAFRARFQLPANDPEKILVPFWGDPGVSDDDVGEANLDLQWAGAVVPDAKILYVYSDNVLDAVRYAIDQNMAPVISMSYGLCELSSSRSSALTMQSWARQANAQGITWLNASGDSGGADCIRGESTNNGQLAVDLPASIPEITGVGGTEFTGGSAYWSATNAPNGLSARSYIPEAAWNDSLPGDPGSGGGGSSIIFGKPAWQTGPGVPADDARNVPDISLTSSAENVGYLVYLEGKLVAFGGTSAAAPAIAGMTVLLNQYLVAAGAQSTPGVGNINPRLYVLAQTAPTAFHDITAGHNIVDVTCRATSRNCISGSYGYNAGPGYDQATGLGSVDAHALVTAWREQFGARRSAASLALTSRAASVNWSDSVTLTAAVNAENGVTPRGSVTFYLGTVVLGSAALTGTGGRATATLSIGAAYLAAGTNTITAEYSGDAAFDTARGAVAVTVIPALSGGATTITAASHGASFATKLAPGGVLSVFGSQLAPTAAAARSIPLPSQLAGVSVQINGIAAPLYYISPGQLNVQVPYETRLDAPVRMTINNNGQVASSFLTVESAAPGIFTDASGALVPANRANRSQVIEMYVTGTGAVSPAVATGAAPGTQTPLVSLPRPTQSAQVTVGGADAPILFLGIPPGLVGVTQVNFQVPDGLASGNYQVLITIGSVTSPPALLTVN